MFVRWENVLDILTDYSVNNNFMETFKYTPNNEKITLCMQNEFIRGCLEQWLDSPEFNDSLKNTVKSKNIRLEANKKFKNDRMEICYKLYTKAAQFAPHKSLEYALAFSNRSAVYIKLNKFQDCIKDIDNSLDVLEHTKFKDREVNTSQLIVKLLKRKIECLMTLKQYKSAQICWEHLLKLSKNEESIKVLLEDQFINKCKTFLEQNMNDSIKDDTLKIVDTINQSIMLTEDIVKTILENNKIRLPFQSSKLKLCFTENKGRHYVALTKIEYGEILIFENPFSFVLLPDYYDSFCYNCCVPLKDYSIPCHNCSTILFCCEKCRRESWNSFHCWECKEGTSIFKCIGIAHLALRLTLETLHLDNKNYPIYNLLTHIEDFKSLELYQYSLTATLLLIYLQKKTDFFEKNPKIHLNSVGNELLLHMTRLVCNGNAISTHVMVDGDSGASTSITDVSQPRIGTAIFPTSSLLNHSCDPNIFSSNILKYVVIKASRIIEKGEEITNCYGPNFRRMRLIERQASLKAQYHFDCKCCVCMDPHRDDIFFQMIEGLVCLSCNNNIQATLTDLDINDTINCNLCSKLLKTLDYKKILIKADKIYDKGIQQLEENNILEAVSIILESLRLYTQVLNKKNSNITKCEDNLAKCFAIANDYKNSYKYLKRSFRTIEERYGKNSLEVAYELDKISDIMINNLDIKDDWNLIKKTLAYVRRSKEIFDANLSAWEIPYWVFSESGMANIKYKEKVLLQIMEDRS